MTSKLRMFATVAGLILMLSVGAFAGKTGKKGTAKHLAFGTIASIDANQVVVNEKVKGKEQQMTFLLNSGTAKSGNLTNGSPVTIQYHTENNQKIANSIRERSSGPAG